MIVTRLPTIILCIALLSAKKIDDILRTLNLGTFATEFRRERIVPSVVQSMSDEEME